MSRKSCWVCDLPSHAKIISGTFCICPRWTCGCPGKPNVMLISADEIMTGKRVRQ